MPNRHLFQVEQQVGRLVEARVYQLATRADVAAYSRAFGPHLAATPDAVLCADHRPVRIYKQDIADELIALFQALNGKWTKVAIVVAPTNATLTMQIARIVRESSNPSRRLFVDAAEATRFLADVLTPAETKRVRSFLASGVDKPLR